MTTKTLGSLATTTLTALQWTPSISDADWATLTQLILNDQILPNGTSATRKRPISPGAFTRQGQLFVPNRGVLQLRAGDWVAVDPFTGWPICIAANSLAATLTATGNTNTSVNVTNLSTNVNVLGWSPGMHITGTDIPANTYIVSIAADGLSLVLSAAATGTTATQTYTVGSFTHS